MEEHIRKLFDLFDIDNNGYLSSKQTIGKLFKSTFIFVKKQIFLL